MVQHDFWVPFEVLLALCYIPICTYSRYISIVYTFVQSTRVQTVPASALWPPVIVILTMRINALFPPCGWSSISSLPSMLAASGKSVEPHIFRWSSLPSSQNMCMTCQARCLYAARAPTPVTTSGITTSGIGQPLIIFFGFFKRAHSPQIATRRRRRRLPHPRVQCLILYIFTVLVHTVLTFFLLLFPLFCPL